MLTPENLENRKKGIGASESSIVLGLNQYISPYQLWCIKTGRTQPEDLTNVPQVYWGNIHEEPIAQHYGKVHNCKVRRVTNTLFHKEHPFLLCHLDRKIEGLAKILECKFAMFAKDNWGESGSDIVPLSYIVQVQHQLAVTGYEEADLAVLIGGWDFRVYHFKRDEAIINKIITECEKFWHCVETDTPPALRDSVDVQLAYPSAEGYKEADEKIIKAVEDYKFASLQEKIAKSEKEKLKDAMALYMKEAEGVKYNGKPLVTYKPTARGNRTLRVMGDAQ